jgi:hypothetical protein
MRVVACCACPSCHPSPVRSACGVARPVSDGRARIRRVALSGFRRAWITLTTGGHTAEMIRLLAALDFAHYRPRLYLVSSGDAHSARLAQQLERHVGSREEDVRMGPPPPRVSGQPKVAPVRHCRSAPRPPRPAAALDYALVGFPESDCLPPPLAPAFRRRRSHERSRDLRPRLPVRLYRPGASAGSNASSS